MSLSTQDWARTRRLALNGPAVVSALAQAPGWQLSGDGPTLAIEKRFDFADYHDTLAFVTAVAFIAHRQDHHPELLVRYNHVVVRYHTHDVQGLTATDFACAAAVDALLASAAP